FHLPGNERYYEADLGLVHLFMLDLDRKEPDGNSADSVQARWLKSRLAASRACFKVVAGHQTPYSSGDRHGSDRKLQWPFAAWGADVVVVGHEHLYERLEVDGIPYLVNGAGGAALYDFDDPLPESRVRFRDDWGALRVTATQIGIGYEFITVRGRRVDSFTVPKRCPLRKQ
ncbi:MAG: metallophosphoesterase family protein, partial [Myxococcaceae bacterium]